MGPPKIIGIEDSICEQEDMNQRQDQTRRELTLTAQMQHNFMRSVLKTMSVANEMHSLEIDQHFLVNILLPPPQIPKTTQIQCDEGIAD